MSEKIPPLQNQQSAETGCRPSECSQSIDWYAEGESRVVDVGGVCMIVRFIGRKGRRGRIAIYAPPGASFRSAEPKGNDSDQSLKRRE
jgi:hypothetical protein